MYSFCIEKQVWDKLPIERRYSLCLDQIEWIISKAMLLGVDIDPRSMNAVIHARKILDDTGEEWSPEIGKEAADAVWELEKTFGSGMYRGKLGHKIYNPPYLALMCLFAAISAENKVLGQSWEPPLSYYINIGSIANKSPLVVRLCESIVEA